jgi:diguanylate cyclase (GGDEF)-like protein/PAS domain S-box-containing protein
VEFSCKKVFMAQRILLIEDDATTAEAILEALSQSNDASFQVEWVRRCSEGLERLIGSAAILADLYLPDSRGITTFDRLFRAAPRIPILLLIDPWDERIGKLAVQAGAQDYLFKARLDSYLLPKAVQSMIERAANAEALFEEKERAQIMLNSIGDAVLGSDVSGQITYLNAAAQGLTGWANDEALGRTLDEVLRIVDATTHEPTPNPLMLAIRDNRALALAPNSILIQRDGNEIAIEDSTAPIHDRHGAVTGAVMVFHDVSASRALTLKMSYLAQHDSLTSLPNRALLNDRLNEAIALSERHERKLSVLFLDLDRFKHVNDSLGHAVGDRLLQTVGKRLFTCVRSSDTVSRQGGDEFVLLLWEVSQSRDAALAAEKILQALRMPYHINQHEVLITGSIGIVTYPDDGTDVETLMKKADIAMYHAKEKGRDRYQFFNSEMNVELTERHWLEYGLRNAIERQELLLHYQPKVNLATGAIVGVEALTRWRLSHGGLVPAHQFIGIAEHCGLIVPFGQWVLREACRQARAWQIAGLSPIPIAINISSVELRAPGFVGGVRAVLEETGLQARYLELELTERVLMEDSPSAAEVLKELKDIGVLLALDDFGTGYSSLSHLKRFPIDALKIDRSFVRDLSEDAGDHGIVPTMIGMGKSLHMRVVAEGVETREQLEILQRHDCPQGQGFYFGRPVPAEDFSQALECTFASAVA